MGACASTPKEELPPKGNCIKSTDKISDSTTNSVSNSISDLSRESISDLSKGIDVLPASFDRIRSIKVKNKMVVVDGNLYYIDTLKPSLSFNNISDDIKQYIPMSKNSISFTPYSKTSTLNEYSSIDEDDTKDTNICTKQQFLTQILTRNVLFNGMLTQIIDAMYKINIFKDEYLMKEIEETKDLQNVDLKYFVVESGVFHLYQKQKKIENFELSKTSTFGETHLVYNRPQFVHLSIKAVTDNGTVWILNRSSYYEIIRNCFNSPFKNVMTTKLNEFNIISTLGSGSFGSVYLVRDSFTKKTYSLKKLSKNKIIQNNQQQYIMNERSVLGLISNDTDNRLTQFCCKLYGTYQDEYYLFFLMEAILGGELYVLLKNNDKFSEKVSRFYLSNIILAIDYLHSYNIIYRDIKPENIMICSNGYIKLIDFGLSKKRNHTFTYCGSPEYVAPEIINGYWQGFEIDYWCLGILLFEMITGKTPFQSYQQILYQNIPNISNHGYSKEILHLITCLLIKHPSNRLGTTSNNRKGINEIYQHCWFRNEKDWNWNALKQQTFKSPYIPEILSDHDLSNFDILSDDESDSDDEDDDDDDDDDDDNNSEWCKYF